MHPVRIFGRSSSVFTRCALIFARELGIPYQLCVVSDLLSQERADYGGNPALKMPTLQSETGIWFGALNISRELARSVNRAADVEWPEELTDSIAANAQELVLQGMATEVSLIMGSLRNSAEPRAAEDKNRVSLENTLGWLHEHLPQVLGQLRPHRTLSFFEVTLFCFITHLEFRKVFDTAQFPRLIAFCGAFSARDAAVTTEYRFDKS